MWSKKLIIKNIIFTHYLLITQYFLLIFYLLLNINSEIRLLITYSLLTGQSFIFTRYFWHYSVRSNITYYICPCFWPKARLKTFPHRTGLLSDPIAHKYDEKMYWFTLIFFSKTLMPMSAWQGRRKCRKHEHWHWLALALGSFILHGSPKSEKRIV